MTDASASEEGFDTTSVVSRDDDSKFLMGENSVPFAGGESGRSDFWYGDSGGDDFPYGDSGGEDFP